MTRRLAQPQQRLEDLHLRSVDAVARDPREQRFAIMRAQLVVMPPLRRLELAVQRLLGPSRQLRRDLFFGPPQDERPQRARQPLARSRRRCARAELAR